MIVQLGSVLTLGVVQFPRKTSVGYPLHSGDPKILWSASRRLGVLVGDDRAVRRRIDRDRLLNESVEEFAATA